MAKAEYLLDLDVVAELTRPDGNRRVFTLFRQKQALCALPAAVIYALAQGIESLPQGARRSQLARFAQELFSSGPPVIPFDREAALWLAAAMAQAARPQREWKPQQGQIAATAAVHQLVLVTHATTAYAGVRGLRTEDWFRP